jgi:hypothetical protein
MPSLRNKLAGLLFFFGLLILLFPQPTFAATNPNACRCFCGTTSDGAVDIGTSEDIGSCSSECRGANTALSPVYFVGCYTTEDAYPAHNDKCWTKDECYSELTAKKITPGASNWGGQSPYCEKLKSGTEMGYCYGKSKPVNLNVPILGSTTVSGMPEYITLMYRFLLPAMSLVAVVMIMIAGLQYATARGNAKIVSEAKTRMMNAVVGLVLLMSVYVIANFLDPKLTALAGLRVPLLKKVILLDADSTCEALQDHDFSVKTQKSDGSPFCGNKGEITSKEKVTENVIAGKWDVGDTCSYSQCGNGGGACMDDGTCIKCWNIGSPSESMCARAEDLSGEKTGDQSYCRYDAKLKSCASVTFVDYAGSFSKDNATSLDCKTLRSQALESANGCAHYTDLQVVSSSGIVNFADSTSGADMLATICKEDPCGLAAIVGSSSCLYTKPSGENSGTCSNVD